jgi:hypothetical protein
MMFSIAAVVAAFASYAAAQESHQVSVRCHLGKCLQVTLPTLTQSYNDGR